MNLAAGALWLRIFSYAPLEWVWRSLAHGRPCCGENEPLLCRRLAQGVPTRSLNQRPERGRSISAA
ncbi:DUF418 domain-containing protein [uncultured Caulobacter sp.]|uniref:DUF418 domain-containing protein n=1 Tax=uncultured Caulobacter sp. TaxID=158749 RepID=UPI00344EFA73